MKAHLHRILIYLPDLLASPLVKELNIIIHDQWTIGPVVDVGTDNASVFICEKNTLRDDQLSWHCVDKDDVNGIEVLLNHDECVKQGLSPRLDAVFAKIDAQRRKRAIPLPE